MNRIPLHNSIKYLVNEKFLFLYAVASLLYAEMQSSRLYWSTEKKALSSAALLGSRTSDRQ